MAGNKNFELAQEIGADLADRLPLDHSLPAAFVMLLGELEAAETRDALKPRESDH
jgi:hypothetical protein